MLAANLLVGVLRVSRGPDVRDRIAGLILLSTTGTAVLLVLAHTVDEPALRVVAAVVVALAAVIGVSLVVHERGRPRASGTERGRPRASGAERGRP